MSADEAALLAAVAADPGSDLPRLVYADWLDDHGQGVRAEFVRLQSAIAAMGHRPQWQRERAVHLWMRQQELLDNHRAELVGDLPDLPDDQVNVVWERGFLAEVTLTADQFLATADRLAARVPLPRVSVRNLAGWVYEFLSSPHLDLVTAADFDTAADPEDVPLGAFVPALAAVAPGFARLEVLDLRYCELLDEDVPTLFGPGAFPKLTHLNLLGNHLSDAGVATLLGTGLPRRLARLVLDGNPVGDQAAFELADRLGKVPTFRTLDFRRTRVTSAGQLALTSAFGSRCNLF